jgi:hypothetical protein
VLRPVGTKAVDAALLLARMLVPEPMRPGWSAALRMSASRLPHARLLDIDARMELAAARPVIVHFHESREAPMDEYDGRQFVGIDLHRQRSVIVGQSESGEQLSAVGSSTIRSRWNCSSSRLAPTPRWCWKQPTAGCDMRVHE